jgi:hypothetical protein
MRVSVGGTFLKRIPHQRGRFYENPANRSAALQEGRRLHILSVTAHKPFEIFSFNTVALI